MFEAKHLDFTAKLYDLALNPNNWPTVLEEYCSFINAGGSSLHIMDSINDVATSTHRGGRVTDEMNAEYNKLHAETDAVALQGLFNSQERIFIHDYELLGLTDIREIEAHPPIKWINDHSGLFWRVASRLNLSGAWLDVITFQFDRDHGPMTDIEKQFSIPFLPHFAKVVELSRAFRILEARFQTVLGALDRLNIGVFITLDDGQIVIRNREADSMLSQEDGIYLDAGNRLTLTKDVEKNQLQQAITESAATASSSGNSSEVLMSVSRKSDLDSFLLAISPIRDDQANISGRFRGALIFAIDPTNRRNISTAGIETLFGLTPAEADVLKKLLEGQRGNDIADSRNTSPETVRGQIKSIMQKTNTSRQSELVRLAISVNMPIEDDQST